MIFTTTRLASLSRTFVACALAACTLALPLLTQPAANAADIYDRGPRTGSAYDDPRYADIYGDTPSQRDHAPRYAEPRDDGRRYVERPDAPPRYAERHEPLPPRGYRDDYLSPMPGVRRFHGGRADDGERTGCIDRRDARARLISEGWRDFRDLELRDEVALIIARRDGGRSYRLKLDRCTGEILNARAIGDYPDSYAERRGSRTFD